MGFPLAHNLHPPPIINMLITRTADHSNMLTNIASRRKHFPPHLMFHLTNAFLYSHIVYFAPFIYASDYMMRPLRARIARPLLASYTSHTTFRMTTSFTTSHSHRSATSSVTTATSFFTALLTHDNQILQQTSPSGIVLTTAQTLPKQVSHLASTHYGKPLWKLSQRTFHLRKKTN